MGLSMHRQKAQTATPRVEILGFHNPIDLMTRTHCGTVGFASQRARKTGKTEDDTDKSRESDTAFEIPSEAGNRHPTLSTCRVGNEGCEIMSIY
jgi:hypothetical protein